MDDSILSFTNAPTSYSHVGTWKVSLIFSYPYEQQFTAIYQIKVVDPCYPTNNHLVVTNDPTPGVGPYKIADPVLTDYIVFTDSFSTHFDTPNVCGTW